MKMGHYTWNRNCTFCYWRKSNLKKNKKKEKKYINILIYYINYINI